MREMTIVGIMILIGMITIILQNMGLIAIEKELYLILIIVVSISSFVWSFIFTQKNKIKEYTKKINEENEENK